MNVVNWFLKKMIVCKASKLAYVLGFAGVLLALSPAKADIIKCTFTEPFYATEYSTTTQKLKISGSEIVTKYVNNVSFQIIAPGTFEIVGPNNVVIQRLYLTGAGADGMSSFVYPFKVKWMTHLYDANHGIGGCESNYLLKH